MCVLFHTSVEQEFLAPQSRQRRRLRIVFSTSLDAMNLSFNDAKCGLRSAMRRLRVGLHCRESGRTGTMLIALLFAGAPLAPQAETIVREAGSFDRAQFHEAQSARDVRAANDLRGSGCCVGGWAEFDISIAKSGWYQIWTYGGALETIVDAVEEASAASSDGFRAPSYFRGGSGEPGWPDKVGNTWLGRGLHRIRFQTDLWNGFSSFAKFEVRSGADRLEDTLAIDWPRDARMYRKGECPTFTLRHGDSTWAGAVVLQIQDEASGTVTAETPLRLERASSLRTDTFRVPCETEGRFRVFVAHHGTQGMEVLSWRQVKGFDYEVVDTESPPKSFASGSLSRGFDIDCAALAPDYESGSTFVRSSPGGAYRESAAVGWMRFQRLAPDAQRSAPRPSWFSYVLRGLRVGARYSVEVTYPDDADRTFGVFFLEPNVHAYPLSVGIESGGPWPNDRKDKRITVSLWPRDSSPRIALAPYFDGGRAACRRITIREVPAYRTPAKQAVGKRRFVHWYEEGWNFVDLFGAGSGLAEIGIAADRWASSVAEVGGTTLMPTVVVYDQELYPSQFFRAQMFPDVDALRRILLAAERFGMDVIPELHPRADELAWRFPEGKRHALYAVSKDGVRGDAGGLPFRHYNALRAENQDWVVAMVGELADRYRDTPAFTGVSLRLSKWANSSLFDLFDLEWGYDDDTLRQFAADTGIGIPESGANGDARVRERSQWLLAHAKDAWVQWRCERIVRLLVKIADRVRQARPDLHLYLHLFPGDDEHPYSAGDTPSLRLREAGIDVGILKRMPAIRLVDSSLTYGRNNEDAVAKGLLAPMRDPAIVTDIARPGEQARFVASHRYLELTSEVFRPADFGFPKQAKATWASVAANPPAPYSVERFARELADGDAVMLGDGGNGDVLWTPGLPAFLANYTALPDATFHDEGSPMSPVVVRSASIAGNVWLYGVNRSSEIHRVAVTYKGGDAAFETPDREATSAGSSENKRLFFTLAPFELITARIRGPAVVDNVEVDGPIVP